MMSSRTTTSKGMRARCKKLNSLVETMQGSIKGLKQQLMYKEQTIERLANENYQLKQDAPGDCTPESIDGHTEPVTEVTPPPPE